MPCKSFASRPLRLPRNSDARREVKSSYLRVLERTIFTVQYLTISAIPSWMRTTGLTMQSLPRFRGRPSTTTTLVGCSAGQSGETGHFSSCRTKELGWTFPNLVLCRFPLHAPEAQAQHAPQETKVHRQR